MLRAVAAVEAALAVARAVAGRRDVAWVWLGSPTLRYPHRALGSPTHAASVHALVRARSGAWRLVERRLPVHRVFEDRVPRLVDIDGDGRDEIVLIEADAVRGASLVVLGLEAGADEPRLVERARSPFAGSPFRWLNPVGVADLDGDGQLDLASVVTPHIDEGTYADHYARFHVAVTGNEQATLTAGPNTQHFAPGEAWWFDHKVRHSARNDSDTDRIHIIIDAVTDRFPMRQVPVSDNSATTVASIVGNP